MNAIVQNLSEAGIRKAAILVACLDRAAADAVLDQLTPEQARTVLARPLWCSTIFRPTNNSTSWTNFAGLDRRKTSGNSLEWNWPADSPDKST